jgi:hypothetical protein
MEVENNLVLDWLSEAHANFILAYVEREQAREEAVVSEFLAAKGTRAADRVALFEQAPGRITL